jgi:hypothetical protein
MTDTEHPDVVLASPNGPILIATWNGAAYECPACHALTDNAEAADQHADVHIARA